jgi:nucleotide-binding universal stress UspA family protein
MTAPQTRSIAVGVDGSVDGRAALEWAVREAAEAGARLHLVHAWEVPPTRGIVARATVEALHAAAESLLAEEAAHARGLVPDLTVTPQLEYGDPAAAILQSTDDADLLVVGSRGRSPATDLVLGSVSRAVVSRAMCPVAVVTRGAASRRAANDEPRPVVVGVDDSPEARTALRWAAGHARERGLPLRVVHAFQPRHLAGVFGIADLQPDALWRSDAKRAVARVIDEEIGDSGGISIEALTARDGPAAAVIAAAADASLVVVGSRGRGRAISVLFGSVSGAVVTDAPAPVVVVPVATARKGDQRPAVDTAASR